LLWIRSEAAAARLWACERALRCADVAAVLAWLPQARIGDLRRLQLAAAQRESLLFVLRPAASTSPRRRLACACRWRSTRRQVAARRPHPQAPRPPLASPIQLPACSERIAALLAASQPDVLRRQQQGVPQAIGTATVVRIDLHQGKRCSGSRCAGAT
jgi:protein ImuA